MRTYARRILQRILSSCLRSNTILVYHRVADVVQDPHQLCVSPKHFRDQMNYLKEHHHVVPLREIVRDLAAGHLHKGHIAITFDDGYADNLLTALPILEACQMPATIFVTTGNVESGESFYWDAGTPREDRGRPMTEEEVRALAAHPLIEIGAHTVHHPKLAKLEARAQREEVQGSKAALERILGESVDGFAYPFGSRSAFSSVSVAAVREAGFRYACANTQERVFFFSHQFALPRVLVRDWSRETLRERLHLS